MRMRHTALVAATIGLAALLPSTASAVTPNFRTPSGNIGCDMRANSVRCDILNYTYRPPRKPASCDFDWGGALYIGPRGRTRFICHSDTVMPPPGRARTAKYGQTIYRNGFSCSVTRKGVTCRNPAGHGFFVSRTAYRRF